METIKSLIDNYMNNWQECSECHNMCRSENMSDMKQDVCNDCVKNISWRNFRKNHPEDFRECCGKIYLKCNCNLKIN